MILFQISELSLGSRLWLSKVRAAKTLQLQSFPATSILGPWSSYIDGHTSRDSTRICINVWLADIKRGLRKFIGKIKAPSPIGLLSKSQRTYYNRRVDFGTNYRCLAMVGGVQSTHHYDKIMEIIVLCYQPAEHLTFTRSNSARHSVA